VLKRIDWKVWEQLKASVKNNSRSKHVYMIYIIFRVSLTCCIALGVFLKFGNNIAVFTNTIHMNSLCVILLILCTNRLDAFARNLVSGVMRGACKHGNFVCRGCSAAKHAAQKCTVGHRVTLARSNISLCKEHMRLNTRVLEVHCRFLRIVHITLIRRQAFNPWN
jgi:hypothetical protein